MLLGPKQLDSDMKRGWLPADHQQQDRRGHSGLERWVSGEEQHDTLPGDLSFNPSTSVRQLTTTWTSSLHGHLHSCAHTHTVKHTYTGLK